MKYRIEIDSREKKSAKKRSSFIRLERFELRAIRALHERFAVREPHVAGRCGIFYGTPNQHAVVIAAFPPFICCASRDISYGNIPKYFQISCDYFCL
ncbi:hypothetical protein ABWH74_003202 [Burkholderia vietnamiensis]|jgi:hypothetical protein|uniref:hypothetical protein n=1 Tax=Burkholderia vietnamiensis TaxID=60552 RepID=UPI000A4BE779|nr:hypothetical protein [Burkholderia vietnamiensis]MBR8188223.1 hypothetical protein [Burkholderia vietnamiensis]MCA7984595.1 hypothetical protein [Burkholderia vietnamiensis]MCA8192841.1 hypothetical protein [Burkholderia vietnamiensis]MCA8226141.1 hypothetical protein [Burkholderia vietnamiensis]MCA8264864.1 hypothetical protein [Burkholderia vietnamiensis]